MVEVGVQTVLKPQRQPGGKEASPSPNYSYHLRSSPTKKQFQKAHSFSSKNALWTLPELQISLAFDLLVILWPQSGQSLILVSCVSPHCPISPLCTPLCTPKTLLLSPPPVWSILEVGLGEASPGQG